MPSDSAESLPNDRREAPPPLEQFKSAVERCDAQVLRDVLERHSAARAAINDPLFHFGGPALGYAASHEAMNVVDVLLEFGADPNRRSDWWAGGFHVLHGASEKVADRLIAAGAVPDACAAAHLDRLELLRDILRADPSRVHERGGDGQTPLHFARSRAVVDLLLEYGADIDARDVDHRSTPAQWMLERRHGAGRYGLAAYLVERGAKPDIFLAEALGLADRVREMLRSEPRLLDLRTTQGEYGEKPPSSFHIYMWTIGANLSPAQVARQFEQSEVLQVLEELATPKHRFLVACAEGNADEARAILREHSGLMTELDANDQRALPDAAWAGSAEPVTLMLELGFDPRTPGQDGGTVLHCGAWEGAAEVIEIALRHPSARELVNLRDPTHGGTPLGWCCHGAVHCRNPRGDYPNVARKLLEAGAEPLATLDEVPLEVRTVIESV